MQHFIAEMVELSSHAIAVIAAVLSMLFLYVSQLWFVAAKHGTREVACYLHLRYRRWP